jgi:DNA-directed RNA polymerase subunit RPC12/RpoP
MKNGQCPRCGSRTIYSQPSAIYFYNNTLQVRTGAFSRGVPFTSYICTTCGFFENYVADQDKLAEVARTWQKVPAGAD